MTAIDALRAGFDDELTKIAKGMCRSGKTPIRVANLLKKATMTKLSNNISKGQLAAAALGGAGAYHIGRKAKRDWETGRAMRLQQGY